VRGGVVQHSERRLMGTSRKSGSGKPNLGGYVLPGRANWQEFQVKIRSLIRRRTAGGPPPTGGRGVEKYGAYVIKTKCSTQ